MFGEINFCYQNLNVEPKTDLNLLFAKLYYLYDFACTSMKYFDFVLETLFSVQLLKCVLEKQ